MTDERVYLFHGSHECVFTFFGGSNRSHVFMIFLPQIINSKLLMWLLLEQKSNLNPRFIFKPKITNHL